MHPSVVFTNNGIVAEFFELKDLPVDVKWVAAPAFEVLTAAKAAIHQGAVLQSNPLAGIRTSQPLFSHPAKPPSGDTGRHSRISSVNPYLSVLTSQMQDAVDFASVQSISEAMSVYKKSGRLRYMSHGEEAIRAFQNADLETLLATIAYVTQKT